MKIEIVSIDQSEIVLVGARTTGYRGRFRCLGAKGSATFVPYAGRVESLVKGARVSVETGQQSVSGFEIVSPERAAGLTELARAGDFAVTGTVDVVVDNGVIEVEVGGLSFAVDLEESGGVEPQSGDRVSFVLHGLSLWCSNVG